MQPVITRSQRRPAQTHRLRKLGISFLGIAVLAACGDDKMGPKLDEGGGEPTNVDPAAVSGTPNQQDWKQCKNNQDRENTECDWVTGNLTSTQNTYFEGDFVPKVLRIPGIGATEGPFELVMTYGFLKGGKTTHDFLGLWNEDIPNANPCTDGSFDGFCDAPDGTLNTITATSNSMATASMNAVTAACGPQYVADMDAGIAAVGAAKLVVQGINVSGIAIADDAIVFDGCPLSGDAEAVLTMTVTPNPTGQASGDLLLLFGAHVARTLDWENGGAGGVNGSPYHLGMVSVDGTNTGSTDLQMSAGAIEIPPGSITIIKDAIPNDAQDFAYTTTGFDANPGFDLDDDADGTLSDTEEFLDLVPGTYAITETLPVAGWALTNIVCTGATTSTVTIGAAGAFDVGDEGVSIDLVDGENITCTFTNTLQEGSIQFVKRIVNDNGGTAEVAAFGITSSAGAPVFGAGVADGPNTLVYTSQVIAVNGGTYTFSESDVAGYTEGTWTCAPTAATSGTFNNGSVDVAPGVDVVCTIENNDDQGSIQFVKRIVNDNGGTAEVAAFGITSSAGAPVFGAGVADGPNTLVYTSQVIDVDAGTYTFSESDVAGYMEGTWTCAPTAATSGTFDNGSVDVGNGVAVVCTIENDDSEGSIQFVKRIVNDNGGTAEVAAFGITSSAGAPVFGAGVADGPNTLVYTSQVIQVAAGTYTFSESDVAGYTEGTWACAPTAATSGTFNSGSVDVANGVDVVCTIENDDDQGSIQFVKRIVNDNGGTAEVAAFGITSSAGAPVFGAGVADGPNTLVYTSQVIDVDAGTYTFSESDVAGYMEGTWTCAPTAATSGTFDNGSVDVGNGVAVVCTIENDDSEGSIQFVKRIVNDNGGTAEVAAFGITSSAGAPVFGAGVADGPNTLVYTSQAIQVAAGTYTFSESDVTGYTEGTWTCAPTAATSGTFDNGSVDVANGVDVVCTIENNDEPVTKSGTKFVDSDADGNVAGEDPYTGGWTIYAFDDQGDVAGQTDTDAQGDYSFTLPAGTYTFCEASVAGWMQSFPNAGTGGTATNDCANLGGPPNVEDWGYTETLGSGDDSQANHFGNYMAVMKSGTKFVDSDADGNVAGEDPFTGGWTIYAFDDQGDVAGQTDTDGSGNYTFTLAPGTYTFCEASVDGWMQSFPNAGTGGTATNDCGSLGPPDVEDWGYTETLGSGDDSQANNFGNYQAIMKSGTKYVDTDADGEISDETETVDGWTIYAIQDMNVVATAITDANGDYSFTLEPGTYTFCEASAAGWTQSFPNGSTGGNATNACAGFPGPESVEGWGYAETLGSGGSSTLNDFGNWESGSKSGFKYLDVGNDGDTDGLPDAGDSPIGGWEISLYEPDGGGGWTFVASTTTAGDGSYTFGNLEPGDYLVCEELKANFIQSFPLNTDCMNQAGQEPGGHEFTVLSGQDHTNNNFFNTAEIFGCTPGYWKNHTDRWDTDYSPSDLTSSVFSNAPADLNGEGGADTLLDALNYRGGRGIEGGQRILLRAAVSSLLNFAADEFIFLIPALPGITTEAQLIAAVNDALAGGRAGMLTLAGQLDDANNAVNSCPLGGTRAFKGT